MSWTEHDTHWSRPLDCHDRLFQLTASLGKELGREHWMIIGSARLDFPANADAERRLRDAWKSLRFRHPDIALELREDEKRYSPVKDETALNAWCDETFRVETAANADDLLRYDIHRSASQATCHWIPASSQVSLVCSHWRWDGRGLVLMLHEFLAGLEERGGNQLPSFSGDEAQRLVPSLDVVMEMPEAVEESWLRKADELVATFMQGQPSIGLPTAAAETTPSNIRRIETVVPKDTTADLVAACHARGITVTTAIHASMVVETARASPDSPSTRFTSWALFDLRKYCPPPFDGVAHAPSLRMLALPLSVDARARWDELTPTINSTYRQPWKPSESNLLFARPSYVDKMTEILKTPPPPEMPPPSEPTLSSLGVLNNDVRSSYGGVVVRDISIGINTLTQQSYVHVWTWNGQLHFSACYNESYYSPDYMQRWLEALRDNLLENLGVGKNHS